MSAINNAMPLEPQIEEQKSDPTSDENQLTVRSESEPEAFETLDIKLTKCEKIVLFCCLIVAFVSTACTMFIAFSSSLRKDSEIGASRPSYWWYFLFCLIVCLSIAQGMATISQKRDNIPFFTCFFILTFFNIIIEIIVILRIIFVLIPENNGSFLSFKCFKS